VSRAAIDGARPGPAWLVNVAGTAGSGKSTFIESLRSRLAPGFALIQPDRIMEAYDGYRSDVAARGAAAAFAAWEPVAWATAFDAMSRLTRRRCPILLELSASDPAHPGLVSEFSRNGYRTCLVLLKTPLETCAERARRRFESGGRHTPPRYVAERHERIQSLLPQYEKAFDAVLEAPDIARSDAASLAVADFVRSVE
jgi:predicted ABC-type ATPase